MNTKIDITGDNFESVGFTEGRLYWLKDFLNNTHELRFAVWGIDILPYSISGFYNKTIPEEDMGTHVVGMSYLTFSQVVSIKYEVALYDLQNKNAFLYDYNGEILKISVSIGKFEEHEKKLYSLELVSNLPFGYCTLHIHSKGIASILYESKNCVPITEYVKNSKKYQPLH